MHPYKKGRQFEYKVKKEFEKLGYFVVRSAGSRGIFDLIAIRKYEVLGIQCKLGKVSEDEVKKMLDIGRMYNIIPVIVTKDGMWVIIHRVTELCTAVEYKKPILLEALYDNAERLWNLSNYELEIYGCGDTVDDALLSAEACLSTLIEEYLLESDDKLSEKALELKNKLKEYVEVIE